MVPHGCKWYRRTQESTIPAIAIAGIILSEVLPSAYMDSGLQQDTGLPQEVFVHGPLATGTKLRVLTIIDTFSRFSPGLDPRFSSRGADVVEVLERVGREIGLPSSIRVDPGTECDLDLWAC